MLQPLVLMVPPVVARTARSKTIIAESSPLNKRGSCRCPNIDAPKKRAAFNDKVI